jgi:hypothetical protein
MVSRTLDHHNERELRWGLPIANYGSGSSCWSIAFCSSVSCGIFDARYEPEWPEANGERIPASIAQRNIPGMSMPATR